ncbi:hypothetical protein [Bilophila wadsworthia]|jgi:hypothetical protein|nr:hypothetical protein [Bilophila wadsworthia]
MREFLLNSAASFIGFGLAVGCLWLFDEIRERMRRRRNPYRG